MFHGAICSTYNAKSNSNLGCFSLGSFIFIRDNVSKEKFSMVRVHEYGHTIQSLIFGPLFLLVVGLPSIIWADFYNKHAPQLKQKGTAYTSRFPEKGANRFGEKIAKNKAMYW